MTTPDVPTLRVLTLEDDALVRGEIARAISTCAGFEVVGDAGTVAAAARLLEQFKPDLALFDLALPDGSALPLIARARAIGTDVIVLTVSEDADVVYRAIAGGATGYLLKGNVFAQVVEALRLVREGGASISPRIARRLFEDLRTRPKPPEPPEPPEPEPPTLTQREREILELFSAGSTYREVAKMLEISVNTVRQHVRNLYEKLHVCSKTEAVIAARGLPFPTQGN